MTDHPKLIILHGVEREYTEVGKVTDKPRPLKGEPEITSKDRWEDERTL